MKRVQEEMDRIGLSENALSKRVGGPPQKTINSVMNGTDPTIATVSQIATGLGVHAWELLIEKTSVVDSLRGSTTLSPFPDIPPVLQQKSRGKKGVAKRQKGA